MGAKQKRSSFAQEFERLSSADRIRCMRWLRWVREQVREGWRGEDIVNALLLHIRKVWLPEDR